MTVKADIRNRALKLIGQLAAGEAASAEDAAEVDAIYTSVHDELIQENLAVWGSGTSDVIPEKVVDSLVRLIGARAAPGFEVGSIGGIPPMAVEEMALGRLRRMLAPDPSGRVVQADYY